MFREYNANPASRKCSDCTVRAIAKVLDKDWMDVYWHLCQYGAEVYDMPSSNFVWGEYLRDQGYTRHVIPNRCPTCYTVREFAEDNPRGRYILAIHGHVVAVVDGDYFDTWDSGDDVPLYYWKRGV